MEKTIIIKYCNDCPFFDDIYFDFLEECKKTGQKVPRDENVNNPIPEWCPLEDITIVNNEIEDNG